MDASVFDYALLRDKTARYGLQALARLQTETQAPHAATVRALSTQVAREAVSGLPGAIPPTASTLSRNIVSLTPGQPVPASFLSQDWKQVDAHWMLPACLTYDAAKCDAYLVDFSGNHTANVVLIATGASVGFVFDQTNNGAWEMAGKLPIAPNCNAVRDALAKGTFALVEPRLQDIQVNGQRIEVEAMPARSSVCAK